MKTPSFISSILGSLWWLPVVVVAFGLYLFAEQRWMRPKPQPSWQIFGSEMLVNTSDLSQAIGGMEGFPVKDIRDTLIDRVPWIRDASVRLVWPSHYEVEVWAREPQAIVGKLASRHARILTTDGVLVRLTEAEGVSSLPKLVVGKHESAEAIRQLEREKRQEVADQIHEIAEVFSRIGWSLAKVSLTEYGAWTLTEAHDFPIQLGSEDIGKRLHQLESLVSGRDDIDVANVKALDLRYKDGAAIILRKGIRR